MHNLASVIHITSDLGLTINEQIELRVILIW
jgi:hypothetical protein